MMKKLLCFTLAIMLALGSFSTFIYGKDGENVENDQDSIQIPEWNSFDMTEDDFFPDYQEIDERFCEAMKQYSLETAKKIFISNGNQNTVYSPANLYMALSMLCELCDNNSRTQLMNLLHLEGIKDSRELTQALYQNLYRDGSRGKTLLGNSFWLNDLYSFNQEPLDILSSQYHAVGSSVPMGAPSTNLAIQNWINEQTNNLLKDAASNVTTTPEILMMLVSTLYFKDTWADEFFEAGNTKDPFFKTDGTEQMTTFMHQEQTNRNYFRNEEAGYTIASLPFISGLSMTFLLPDEGVKLEDLLTEDQTLEDLLTWENADEWQYADINWTVPKFDINSNLDLVDTLSALGVSDIFNANTSDFTPLISSEEKIVVSKIQHAGRVKIDEEGCEAAAFTVISLENCAFMPEERIKIEMNLNRPFLFTITGENGLPLFMGTVNSMEE